MKKYLYIILVIFIILILLIPFIKIVYMGNSISGIDETLINSSVSPNGEYILEAYLVNAGATVDFSVKVYLIENDKKKPIYFSYHAREADIQWINDYTVAINNVYLDLSIGETYDNTK